MKKAFYTSIICLILGVAGLASNDPAWVTFYGVILLTGCFLMLAIVAIVFTSNDPDKL